MSHFDIFERFSETLRRVLINSQNIAKSMNSNVGSPHVLLALTATPGSLAHDILREQMISVDQIRLVLHLEEFTTQSTPPRGFSQELQKVIQVAGVKASDFNHFTIDSEHLLLALTTDKSCLAYKIIEQLGVNPAVIRTQIETLFDDLSYIDELVPLPIDPEMMSEMSASLEAAHTHHEPIHKTQSKSATPTLDYFTSDLTNQAKNGELDPVIGREAEMYRTMQILCRRTKRNPVLTGDPGVGKTAIIEGLAQRINTGHVPLPLKNKRIAMLDMALLIAGTTYRGQFEDRVKKVLDELTKHGNIILFIDEMHTLVGAGSAEGSLDMANILKPALAKGKLQIIGATTNDEFRKYIEKDPALERRVQRVNVAEPSVEESEAIIQGLRGRYESFHNVTMTDEAIKAAVHFSDRYIADRFLPDKAIDLLDEAAASLHVSAISDPVQTEIGQLEQKRLDLKRKKEVLLGKEQFEQLGKVHAQELKIQDTIKQLQKKSASEPLARTISANDIAKVVAQATGVPLSDLLQEERLRLLSLEGELQKRVAGQDEAITLVARAIRRNRTRVSDPKRPIGNFLFLGPTGVGKTELARSLAELVFGRENALIKVDMSEFMERHAVSRLVGAPPGYVGYEDSGKLTEAVRKQPYSVVLFDEIEKAHPEIFNILLQIMDEGILTDAKGRKVNFRNTVIILTSNIGMAAFSRQSIIGFQKGSTSSEINPDELDTHVRRSLKDSFQPEFLNRLDTTIVFRPLTKATLRTITDIHLDEALRHIWRETGLKLDVTPAARDFIAEKGYDPEFGARPLKRAISEHLHNPLAEAILANKFLRQKEIRVLRKGDALVFRK